MDDVMRSEVGADYPVGAPETVSMTTRDGVRLDADVYRPTTLAQDTFPVLLMRQPYGRRIASTVTYAHPLWYAAQGYIVVIQDVRGRGSSEGDWRAFEHEGEDGADTVRWAAALPGSSGAVGMYGFSYQGATQFLAAGALAAEDGTTGALRAIAPAMTGYRMYDDWAYEGGAFALAGNLSWGIQVAVETARRAGDAEAFHALIDAAATPWRCEIPCVPDVLRKYAAYGHYMDWVSTPPEPHPYWDHISPAANLGDADLPTLHIGGWYDSFLGGTLAAFTDLRERLSSPQHLVVGPWTHLDWTGTHPAYASGQAGGTDIDRMQVYWFDHWLKDAACWRLDMPRISLFEMGSNQWRHYNRWNDTPIQILYLTGDGRASLNPLSGGLAAEPGLAGSDSLVLDPWRPPPSHGGHSAPPAGRVDRSAVDRRGDILTFTSRPLEAPIRLAGSVAADLYVTADQPSFDISATLSEVFPDGRVINLTQGYRRVNPEAAAGPIRIDMRGTAAEIASGTALRLSIAPSAFPAFPVNGGDGGPPHQARRIDQNIVTLTLRHGGDTRSCLLLPVFECA